MSEIIDISYDYSPDERRFIREQRALGIERFTDAIPVLDVCPRTVNGIRSVTLTEDATADKDDVQLSAEETIINNFLAQHPNAQVSNETVRGFPLIIDKTRRNLSETVGNTGVAYPTFEHPYSETPNGYAFHAVHSAIQSQ